MVEWRPDYPIDPDEYDQEADAISETDPEDNLKENKYDAIDPDEVTDLQTEARVSGNHGAAVHAQAAVAEADETLDYDDKEELVNKEAPEVEQAPKLTLEDDASCKDVNDNTATAQEVDQASTQSAEEGAPTQAAVPHTNNLCQSRVAHDSFIQFFDSPHGGKSYFPPQEFYSMDHTYLTSQNNA